MYEKDKIYELELTSSQKGALSDLHHSTSILLFHNHGSRIFQKNTFLLGNQSSNKITVQIFNFI
jgi:hypothetical protein